ncbi:MAG: peroxiredoxin [Epsilonproteobacteria bacterium]|nr:peroxiredoxin [Campylobacterota bacterium]
MIKIGTKAPDFTCEAAVENQIKTVSLQDFHNKHKLLFFYPLDFTFVCPTELHALNDNLDEFKKRGIQLLGASVDSVYSHLSWLRTPKSMGGIQGIAYPLLSDLTKNIAREYGVLNEEQGVALRGVFLIDKNNIIQHASINNLPLGRNVDEILRTCDALLHFEQNGQVCPANWTPGKPAMQATEQGVREYFKESV